MRSGEPAKPRRSDRGTQGVQEFLYPDHTRPLVRRVILGTAGAIAFAAAIGAYFVWKDSTAGKYQDYLRNVRESIAAHHSCIDSLKSGMDLEGGNRRYHDAKAKIEYLLSVRRHLPEPPEPLAADLLHEEQGLHEELAVAERKSLRDVTPLPPKQTEKPEDSTAVRGSALSTPDLPKAEKAGQLRARASDPTTVVVALPGVAQGQVSSDLLRRFADLADKMPGQATPVWAGDLLTIHVKPVEDPAKFAVKIRFGRILYYSNKDRALTLQLSADQQAELADPARNPMNVVLSGLKQRENLKQLTTAMASLNGLKTLDRQAEIAAALEAIAGEAGLDQNIRDAAVKLLPAWSGGDCVPLLLKLLEDAPTVVKWTALDVLVELKATGAADAIAKKWTTIEPTRVSQALIGLGPDVEKVVLPYLYNTGSNVTKLEVCKVLKEVGRSQSLKPLLDIVNDKSQPESVIAAAKEAMKVILERK